MLVLSRSPRPGVDTVVITIPPSTETQTVEVVAVTGGIQRDKVRLGFKASESISIMRKELISAAEYDRKETTKKLNPYDAKKPRSETHGKDQGPEDPEAKGKAG